MDLRTPLASSLVQNTTNSNNARNVFPSSLLSNLRLREIRRPYTCFCEWFSIVPYSNVEKKKINNSTTTLTFTLFSHTYIVSIIFELFEFVDFVNVGIQLQFKLKFLKALFPEPLCNSSLVLSTMTTSLKRTDEIIYTAMLVADSLQPTWTTEPLLLRHWFRTRPIQTMRETYSLLPCWAIFDMREIRRPYTCFLRMILNSSIQ